MPWYMTRFARVCFLISLKSTARSLNADLFLEYIFFMFGFLHLCHSCETRVCNVARLDRGHHLSRKKKIDYALEQMNIRKQ